jgi:hypothetical protein
MPAAMRSIEPWRKINGNHCCHIELACNVRNRRSDPAFHVFLLAASRVSYPLAERGSE